MLARIISVLILCFSSALAVAQAAKPIEIADDAPDHYVVVPGDTLWGISGKFLKEPYRWPEVWQMNKDQIKNPHWIYPGQEIVLDRSGGQPRLKLGGITKLSPSILVEDVQKAIPAIPQQIIEPFLSQPLVVETRDLNAAPRIVATQEDRVFVGSHNVVYAIGIDAKTPRWQIYRAGQPMLDPETNGLLGYEAFYLGTANQPRPGEPATLESLTARQEIGRDDRLVVAKKPEVIAYVPHAPAELVRGRVVSVYGGLGEGGKYSIVALSRGSADHLEIGHVLALYRAGMEVHGRYEGKLETYTLPDERYGLTFIFRVFDRVSYALVMNADRPIKVGDVVRTP